MSLEELAAYVSTQLEKFNIPVVLVGGACVSIYSNNQYQTSDLDFVEQYHAQRSRLKEALERIGFLEKDRYFVHPDAKYFLEFPVGPLAVGDEPVKELNYRQTSTGTLRLLTSTDCIKDRLAAYYHWQDKQALQQALWVAKNHSFDMDNVRKWSVQEGMNEKFSDFEAALIPG